MSTPPRSVKIADEERGGWSSDRPRRPGEPARPPRKQDVGVRGRVLAPTDRLRYSPGSLLVVVSPDREARDRFIARVLEEQSALLSLDKVRALLAGKVPAGEVEAKAQALLDAAATKRLTAGQTVVIAADGLEAEERERYVRLAAPHRRPRHLILLEAARDAVAEADRATLADLRTALDAGELGAEGFATSLRLGGRTIGELKRIVFVPPPSDD
jgi:predicted kinase